MKLANRSRELSFFMQMMQRTVPQRILLIEAPSGYGKTDLLTKFGKNCPAGWRLATLDLKNTPSDMMHLISRLQQKLGHDHFRHYQKAERELSVSNSNIDIANNRIVGDKNIFQVILKSRDEDQRNLRLSNLQKAFFHDLGKFNQPILLLLDTFNSASGELRSWLGGRFLAEVAELQNLIVVIAGQEVPQPTIEWQNYHCCYHLDTILEVDAWYEYAQAQGFLLNSDHIWAIVRLMNGRPNEIVKAFQILERESNRE